MDLMEAYAMAKERDPLFGSSFYEHEAAKTQPAQGRALLLPQIQAYGTKGRYHYSCLYPSLVMILTASPWVYPSSSRFLIFPDFMNTGSTKFAGKLAT